jgi:hypothetical protein
MHLARDVDVPADAARPCGAQFLRSSAQMESSGLGAQRPGEVNPAEVDFLDRLARALLDLRNARIQ